MAKIGVVQKTEQVPTVEIGFPIFSVWWNLEEGAAKPTKAYHGDAGWDLYTKGETTVEPGQTVNLSTGVRCSVSLGYFLRITGRSSARSRGLLVHEGVIDNGYRGELFVCVTNTEKEPVTVADGERVGQLLFHQILVPTYQTLLTDAEFESSFCRQNQGEFVRGDKGFGSSGE